MAGRAGRAGRPRGRAEHLARGRRTAETAGLDDEAGREAVRSATDGGLGCGGGDGMRRRDELDTRAGLGDGGEIEDGGGGGEDRRVDRKVEDT